VGKIEGKKILHCRRFEKKVFLKKLNCKDGKEIIDICVLFPILKKFDEKNSRKTKTEFAQGDEKKIDWFHPPF
jgi:hypothetical protein